MPIVGVGLASIIDFNQQIVSSIATYLVVLVQFKMSEEDAHNSTSRDDVNQYAYQVNRDVTIGKLK